jgi:hypothetical protein
MDKLSYNMKELADLLDVGETTLANQIVPVLKAVLAEILDETVRAMVDQKERIALLEEENMSLHRRLRDVEAQLFPELADSPHHELELIEPAMVDLESVLGIELEGSLPSPEERKAPSGSDEKPPAEPEDKSGAEGVS